ncbi:MAG: transcriptional regulator, partial [Acetobacteraceae bacterium]
FAEATTRVSRAVKSRTGQPPRHSFVSHELLWHTLTPARWNLLQAMAGQGPMQMRELARRIDRDIKSVHGDVQKLLNAGLLNRADDGRIEFPYDDVHLDVHTHAA